MFSLFNEKAAFIFPLHEPHFSFGNNLIASFNRYFSRRKIFVVFSNEFEKNTFSVKYGALLFESLVYPHPIEDGIITKKKYFGIMEIIKNYSFSYIACIDAECVFFKSANLDFRFRTFYWRKTLFASLISNEPTTTIIKDSLKFFTQDEQDKLRIILRDTKAYFWFNEIPIYHAKTFLRFNKHLNIMNRFDEITWYNFDFIIYAYYCLLHEGFKLTILNNEVNSLGKYGILESQVKIEHDKFLKSLRVIKPNWIKEREEQYNLPFMSFHHDRDNSYLD